MGLTRGLSTGMTRPLSGGGAVGVSSGPLPPAGAQAAFIFHPRYTASDASHLVPCAAGDAIRWIKDAITGVWYEQAVAGSRPILRSAGGGKWYGEGNGTSRTIRVTDLSAVAAANFTVGSAQAIVAGTTYGMTWANSTSGGVHRRDLRQDADTLKMSIVTNNDGGALTESTADTLGVNYAHIAACGATTTMYRDGVSAGSSADSTSGTLGDPTCLMSRDDTGFYANINLYGLAWYTSTLDASGVATFNTWLRNLMP